MAAAFEAAGNPSSIHAEGRAARALVEDARRAVAALVGVPPRAVSFTSGGTEAVNTALTPEIAGPGIRGRFETLIVAAGEHVAALQGRRFAPSAVVVAPLDADGRVDLSTLEALLGEQPALVALQAANNETGVLQPVAEAAALVHARGGLLFCDAAQFAGRLPCDAAALGADMLALSAHKFGGPKGVGALVLVREGLQVGSPLIRGGGQERGARAGTENVAGIVGFGAAAHGGGAWSRCGGRTAWRGFATGWKRAIFAAAPDATIFSRAAPRLPNTVAFAVPGVPAATLLMRLDLEGIAASSGSACSSGKVTPSHVLAAMQVPLELAKGAIRLSVGWASSEADVEAFADAFTRASRRPAA